MSLEDKFVIEDGVLKWDPVYLDFLDADISIVIPEGVTSLEDSVFQNMSISAVTFPSSLTSIGEYAFSGCRNLNSVDMPFITTIGRRAFFDCGLASVHMPKVQTIGPYAFGKCVMTEITFPRSLKSIGKFAFVASRLISVVLPPSVKVVEKATFADCKFLTTIDLGRVTTIETFAFAKCQHLYTVNLPITLTTLQDKAFFGCTSLESVYNYSAVDIGSAFEGCTGLNHIMSASADVITDQQIPEGLRF